MGSEPVLVARVVPDVAGIDKAFDYVIPPRWATTVSIGSLVRVDLNGRRIGGWVVGLGADPPAGIQLRAVAKVSSAGPSAEVIELAEWAAHRWSGRLATLLKTASPDRMVPVIPRAPDGADPALDGVEEFAAAAFGRPGVTLVRLPPGADVHAFVLAAAATGDAVIVTPSVGEARHHGATLRRNGGRVYLAGRDFSQAATAGSVIGARSGVWARVRKLSAVLVIDEHDEGLQEERNPTWHARDVAIERARRAGVPCVLVSPAPSLSALAVADHLISPSRADERRGWPTTRVVDRRKEDPARGSLFSPQLVDLVRSGRRVLCILNRKGRARMLACAMCGELARTGDGTGLMSEIEGALQHEATGETRPLVCAVCGATKLKRIRLGISRAAEELSSLVGEPVAEVSASAEGLPPNRVLVGTEALLHRAAAADAVAFLDFDQELLAARYRAGEQAMALLVRAARLVGGKQKGSQSEILIQTRLPDHRVVRAAVRADPGEFAAEEAAIRRAAGFPPFGALAEISGAPAAQFVEPLQSRLDVDVLGPRADGRYLLRTENADHLAEVLASAVRPKGRLRVAVDPPRV